MPSGNARIEALHKRIAARNERNEIDKAAAAKLAADLAKIDADKQRRADNHAKILLGAAVLLLPFPAQLRTVRVLFTLLTGRHREFLEEWAKKRGIDIHEPVLDELSVKEHQLASTHDLLVDPIDPIGTILAKAFVKMDEGAFGLIAPDILARTDGEDRLVLQDWYAKLAHSRQSSARP